MCYNPSLRAKEAKEAYGAYVGGKNERDKEVVT